MKYMMIALLSSILTSLSLPTQANELSTIQNASPASASAHIPSNHIALFTGMTAHEEQQHLTLGLDYEYRCNACAGLVGTGFMMDYAFQDVMQTGKWSLTPAVFFHPNAQITTFLAPGMQLHREGAEAVIKAGLVYALPDQSRLSIAPTFGLEWHPNSVGLYYGFNIGGHSETDTPTPIQFTEGVS